MSTSKSSWEDREYSSSVGAEPREYAWAVTVNTSDNTNMLSRFRKRNKVSVDIYRRYDFRIFNIQFLARGGKHEKLSLLWDEGDIVALAILQCEMEEVLEAKNVIGLEGTVICLANTGHNAGVQVDPEVGVLGNVELVVVGQLVQPVTVHPALLDAKLVQDGAH